MPVTVEQDPALMMPVDNPAHIGSHEKLNEETDWTPT